MGKKEQLEQIISLLASEKTIIKGDNINFTQEDFDELVPKEMEVWTKNYPDFTGEYDATTKVAKVVLKTGDTSSKILFNSPVTDVESFIKFHTSYCGAGVDELSDPIIYYYHLYCIMMLGIFFMDTSAETPTIKSEYDMSSIKDTYPYAIKILQTYLKLYDQVK